MHLCSSLAQEALSIVTDCDDVGDGGGGGVVVVMMITCVIGWKPNQVCGTAAGYRVY